MPVLGLLVRLCVLAFVLAGLVIEAIDWKERRRAIRTLLSEIPAVSQVQRPLFETPTLTRLGRLAPDDPHATLAPPRAT